MKLIALLVCFSLSACAGFGGAGSGPEYDHVIVQVCIPDSTFSKSLWFNSVENGSYSNTGEKPVGKTTSGQPIYESFGGRPKNQLAFVISTSRETSYVYHLPKNLSTTGWSDWKPAEFVTHDEWTAQKVLRGVPLEGKPATGLSHPKMRFRIMSFIEYLKIRETWRHNETSDCNA
jgi:hypothetical protein